MDEDGNLTMNYYFRRRGLSEGDILQTAQIYSVIPVPWRKYLIKHEVNSPDTELEMQCVTQNKP